MEITVNKIVMLHTHYHFVFVFFALSLAERVLNFYVVCVMIDGVARVLVRFTAGNSIHTAE